MAETIFDKILRKEIPANIIYEDDHVLAFHDINPQAPVHVLVIPKKKEVRFADFDQSDPLLVGHLFVGAAKVAQQLGLGQHGFRIVVNDGQDGQQTVDYVHVHIIGGRQLRWPPG